MNINEMLLNMLQRAGTGVDANLIKADAIHEVSLSAETAIREAADSLFANPAYINSAEHMTHEMITQLHLASVEQSYLLRAILNALKAGGPAELSFEDAGPWDLEVQKPEPVHAGNGTQ